METLTAVVAGDGRAIGVERAIRVEAFAGLIAGGGEAVSHGLVAFGVVAGDSRAVGVERSIRVKAFARSVARVPLGVVIAGDSRAVRMERAIGMERAVRVEALGVLVHGGPSF